MKSRIFSYSFLTFLPFMVICELSGGSFNFPTKHYGISFGNSKEFTGIRFNIQDSHIKQIDGLNITLWLPDKNPEGVIRGLALGVFYPQAKEIYGVAAGLGVDGQTFHGLGFGVLGIGGKYIRGVCVGGLGVGGENLGGILLGGLGVGGQVIRGFAIGGLGVGGEDLKGIFLGGLGVGGEKVEGFSFGFLGVGGENLRGVMIGSLGVGGDDLKGVMLTGGYLKAETLHHVGAAGLVRVKQLTGISIGIVNIAHELHGVQLGLFNWAGNNPFPFKILPFINLHFD